MGVTIRQRPPRSGTWWVFVNHNNQRLAKKIGKNHPLAKEVAKKLEEQIIKGDLGFLGGDAAHCPTLREYVNGWESPDGYRPGWIDVAQLSRKHSTRKSYEAIIATHLLPTFGNTRLDRITSRQIGDLVVSLLTRKGLRSQTVKNIKNCLSAILQHACNPDGYIPANPARGVTVPTPERERPSREPDPFTFEERTAVEKVFADHYPEYYPLIVCGSRSGLRIGELIGLQIGDIDYTTRLITVQRNITRGRVTTPKSKSSRRQVRMTSQLVEVLQAHRSHVKELSLKAGKDVPDWLFVGPAMMPINYGNFIHRIWNRAMEKTGLRRRTPHDMRHTYATLRLSNGDSLAEVSKEMGHSTVTITYQTYYKWIPSESRSDIDQLDNPDATNRNLYATKTKRG